MESNQPDSVVGDEPSPGITWMLTQLLLLALAVTTVLSLFARGHWFADLLANLRMQQLIALLAAFLLCAIHRRRVGIVAAAVMIAIHLPSFVSALPLREQSKPADSRPLTITLANVLTQNIRHDDILADVTYRQNFFPFGLVLDHALISSDLHCVSHKVGPDIGSDHRSVTCRFSAR